MIGQHLIEKDTNERAILAAAAGHVKGGGLIFYSKTDADGDFTTFIVTDELPTTPMPREDGETSTLRTIFGSNGREPGSPTVGDCVAVGTIVMAELIGVAASSSVASGFKQELMLFDRIALPCAADVLRS